MQLSKFKLAAIPALCLILWACEDEETITRQHKRDFLISSAICISPSIGYITGPITVRAYLPASTTSAQCSAYSNASYYQVIRSGTTLSGYIGGSTGGPNPNVIQYEGYCLNGSTPQIRIFVTDEEPGSFTIKINIPGFQSAELMRNVTITGTRPLYNFPEGGTCPAPLVPAYSDGFIETTLIVQP